MSEPDTQYRLKVEVLSPEKVDNRGYRSRESLGSLFVPLAPERAWVIYQRAVAEAMGPGHILKFPQELFTDDEIARIRAAWNERH